MLTNSYCLFNGEISISFVHKLCFLTMKNIRFIHMDPQIETFRTKDTFLEITSEISIQTLFSSSNSEHNNPQKPQERTAVKWLCLTLECSVHHLAKTVRVQSTSHRSSVGWSRDLKKNLCLIRINWLHSLTNLEWI